MRRVAPTGWERRVTVDGASQLRLVEKIEAGVRFHNKRDWISQINGDWQERARFHCSISGIHRLEETLSSYPSLELPCCGGKGRRLNRLRSDDNT